MKLFAVESNTIKLDGGCLFGHVPKKLWASWIPADENNCIQIACRTLLAQTPDGRNILFDAGVGDFFDAKYKSRYGIEGDYQLQKNLAKLGIREDEIDAIILSHLHFDHAGGIFSSKEGKTPELLFPKANYYLSKEHWEYAKRPHVREHASFIPMLPSLLEPSERLRLVEGAEHPDFDCGLTFSLSHGHTRGLMMSRLESSAGPLVFASDLVPGLPWIHLPVTMGYDRHPELIVDEKEALLARLCAEQGRLFFAHHPDVAVASVQRDERGRYQGSPSIL